MDGGSSDKFIQPRVAQVLKLPIEPTSLKVLVGNGQILNAEGKIQQLPLTLKFFQNGQFIPLQGEGMMEPSPAQFHQFRRLHNTDAI